MSVIEQEEEIIWDGRIRGYRPGSDWRGRVSDEVLFHEDSSDEALDAATYEVIRHRLWSTNLAHGETLVRISVSPAFQALDFNMCVLTEDGETVMTAPYYQHLTAGAPLMVQYILEHFGGHPGIHEGDVFLANDPWIGAVHQMDVFLCAPMFVDGRLYAWVCNAAHQYDLGGVSPGGWPQNAVDVFHDPVVLSPFKLVERHRLRPDLESLFLRQSRTPDLVAIDLRAQLAGCRFAINELQRTVGQFGAATVKAAMRRVIDNAQDSLSAKLSSIPDGKWSEVRYFDEKLPGDRSSQRAEISIEKIGDRLILSNAGSDPQELGPNNLAFSALAGAALGALNITMLHDQLYAVGGGSRQLEIRAVPGLVTCADYPAAVSGGVLNQLAMVHAVMAAIAKMLAGDADLSRGTMAAASEATIVVVFGADEVGRPFGSLLTDPVGIGSGARPFQDGVDTGGAAYAPMSRVPNVEESEQFYPIIYLYRKQVPDSGGAGRWRGGGSHAFAWTGYRAGMLGFTTNAGVSILTAGGAPGLMGGYPAPTTEQRLFRDTNLLEMFASGQVPVDLDHELKAVSTEYLRAKTNETMMELGDVGAVRQGGGAGYGDPLQRPAVDVAEDVSSGWVSLESAERVYGVVLDGGGVDAARTEARRAEILDARAGWRPAREQFEFEPAPPTAASGAPPRLVHAYILARDEAGARVLACSQCDAVLSPYRANYKSGLLLREGPVMAVPLMDDPKRYVDDEFVFRRYCCPGCRILMVTEVVKKSEPPLAEMVLA